LFILTKTERF